MAYKVKRRMFQDFRHEFPQLCAPVKLEPMDFSVLTFEPEEVVKPVKGLPPGWINVRTYLQTYVKPEEPDEDAHTLMYRCIRKMRTRWEKWNREHGLSIDYDEYDDGLDYEDEEESEAEDSDDAEDPEDEWSD